MKISALIAAFFLMGGACANTHDIIKKAIENRDPTGLLQFNVKEIAQLTHQKKEYMRQAQKAAEQAKQRLQKSGDWRERLRLLGGIGFSITGAYLVKRYIDFITALNEHGYYEGGTLAQGGTAFIKESKKMADLVIEGLGGPGGLLMLLLGLQQCYRGVTAYDRKWDFTRSLQVKDAIDEWGNVLS